MIDFSHVMHKVIDRLAASKLITGEDEERLREVLAVVISDDPDLERSLRTHLRHQLTAGYYYNYLSSRRRELKDEMERRWYDLYGVMLKESGKRPTESQVTATLRHDEGYRDLLTRESQLRYLTDQLSELHAAFQTRARMLEQISNNHRMTQRLELGDTE